MKVSAMTTGEFPPEARHGTLEFWKARAKGLESLNAEAVESLKECLRVIEMLMPGLRHAVVQDYALINDVPVQARRIIAKMEGKK